MIEIGRSGYPTFCRISGISEDSLNGNILDLRFECHNRVTNEHREIPIRLGLTEYQIDLIAKILQDNITEMSL